MNVIETTGLTFVFPGGERALDGIDLAVPAGGETEWQIRYEFYELKRDSR